MAIRYYYFQRVVAWVNKFYIVLLRNFSQYTECLISIFRPIRNAEQDSIEQNSKKEGKRMYIITYILWLSLAFVLGFAVLIIARTCHLRWTPSFLLASLVAASLIAGLYIARSNFSPKSVKVTIESPKTNTKLKRHKIQISGTVFPANARVAVAIRSEKDPRWWIQSVIRPDRQDGDMGKWSINGYLGTPNAGKNENFYIVALASADNPFLAALTGHEIRKKGSVTRLPIWIQSPIVVIRRIQ